MAVKLQSIEYSNNIEFTLSWDTYNVGSSLH